MGLSLQHGMGKKEKEERLEKGIIQDVLEESLLLSVCLIDKMHSVPISH